MEVSEDGIHPTTEVEGILPVFFVNRHANVRIRIGLIPAILMVGYSPSTEKYRYIYSSLCYFFEP